MHLPVVISPRKGRSLAVATAVVFVISSIFPVGAGLSRNNEAFPRTWGIMDVVIAFLLMALAILTVALFERAVSEEIKLAAFRAYRLLANGILFLLVVFFLAGDRITWTYSLPGFAWRAWLLVYALPAWLAAFQNTPAAPRKSSSPDLQ